MIEDIILLSGNDIPFFSAQISIHQPRLKEIAFIGEENFFLAIQLLNFSKEMLKEEDKISLTNIDDFDILMSILYDEQSSVQREKMELLFTLLFPGYDFSIDLNGFHLIQAEREVILGKELFSEFKDIIHSMFNMQLDKEKEFKPANDAAKKIAEKLKKGREKVAEAKGETKKVSILSRYVSILAIGLQKDINSLFEYTVYQLNDEFKRFQMYQAFDINLQARMAGATDLEDVDNWMDDIHQ